MTHHAWVASLAAGLLLTACGPAPKPPELPHFIDPCPDFPVVTTDRCLMKDWVVDQAKTLGPFCGDRLVNECYDLFEKNQDTFGAGACNDYWKPCVAAPPCPASGGEKPKICYQLSMSLYPTYLASSGFINPNLLGLACSKLLIPGKPQVTTPVGKPLLEELTDRNELRTNPTWQEQSVGLVTFNRAATMPDSPSLPMPSGPQAAGQRSLAFFNFDQVCAGDGTAPTLADKRYTMTEQFLNPFKSSELEISGLGSCSGYVLNKYYDWNVFRMRMLPELNDLARTPAILRVRAAYSNDLRGNLGRLALLDGPMSRSYVPAQFSVGPNKNFELWDTRIRAANPFDEFLAMSARAGRPSTPQDHRHRFLFSNPVLAAKAAPAEPENYPPVAKVSMSWNWHAAMLQKYDAQQVTPTDEKWFRLRRNQFLDLVVRRAQLEVAAKLAGRDVNLLSASTLWAEPSGSLRDAWWLSLSTGVMEPTLESLTTDERRFVKAQYAHDFEATKSLYATFTDAEVEARLKSLDELIESFLTKADTRSGNTLIATCLTLDVPTHSVLCEWLPEMFTDLFTTVTETDLLALPPKAAGQDFPLAGPEADKRKCESYTRGVSFSKLDNQLALVCPLNSSVGSLSRFKVCQCKEDGAGWRCGRFPFPNRYNTEADPYPVFYDPTPYRASLDSFEGFFDRADLMNQVAFEVATAFIPPCSDSPTMTELHSKTFEVGNGTFGASMTKTFLWSKDAKTDQSNLDANFDLRGTVLGIPQPFLAMTSNASGAYGATNGQAGATLKVVGIDVAWSADTGSKGPLGDIHGSFYFSIGPIPVSVRYGVMGEWQAQTKGVTSPSAVSLLASAGASARLYVEGGVDIGIAGVGLGVELELFSIGPKFDSRIGLRTTPPGQSTSTSISLDLKSSLVLNTNLLSGRFYAWAEIGICPFCESFDVTLFDWSGFHFTTPVWSREFRLTEANLDKLQGWSRPPSCQ